MKTKRLLSLILCLALVISLLPIEAFGTDTGGMADILTLTDAPTEGEYKITGYAGLQKLSQFTQSSTLAGVSFYLAADITANAPFTPIGDFAGTFDGNGHTVTGLFAVHYGAGNVGLFTKVLPGGVVRNLDTDAELPTVTVAATTPTRLSEDMFEAAGDGAHQDYDVEFELELSHAVPYPVKVSYQTLAGAAVSFTTVNGTTLTFEPGETVKSASVSVGYFSAGDEALERWGGDRSFLVRFYNPVNARLVGDVDSGVNAAANGRSAYAAINLYMNLTFYNTEISSPDPMVADALIDVAIPSETSGAPHFGKNLTYGGLNLINLLPALQDSSASGVRLSATLVGVFLGTEQEFKTVNARLTFGTMEEPLYDAEDYAGWPVMADAEGYNMTAFDVGYIDGSNNWIEPPGGYGSFVYYIPRDKYIDYIKANHEDYGGTGSFPLAVYDMYIEGTADSGMLHGDLRYQYLSLVDFTPPAVNEKDSWNGPGIKTPTALFNPDTTFGPGDVIPITVEFSEAVTVTGLEGLKVNGEDAPLAGNPGSSGTRHTFLYTVQDMDNANSLEVSAPDGDYFVDLVGNEIATDGSIDGSIDFAGGHIIDGLSIHTPEKSQAIYALTADGASYAAGDTIGVTLADYPGDVSLWLRNTVGDDELLGGAYLAARNLVTGELDTYPLYSTGDDGGSAVYEAAIPASAYARETDQTLELALFYGDGVTQDGDGSFSGGTLARDKLLTVGLEKVVLVTDVTLDGTKYPENGVIYTTASAATRLAASIATATQPEDGSDASYPALAWSSSNVSVATIDPDGTIRPVSAGAVSFTATANNGGFGAVSDTTPEFAVVSGGPPAIVIPTNACRFSTRQGEGATVRFSTNLEYANTAFTLKLYEGGSVSGSPVYEKAYGAGELTAPAVTIPGAEIDLISPAGADLSLSPAYTFTVEAPNPDAAGETLSATGYLVVYPQPASVRFEPLDSYYITDATDSVDIAWALANLEAGDAFTLNIYKNDGATPLYSTSDKGQSRHALAIDEVEDGRLKDVYTVQAGASNISGPCVDSFLLYVYDDDALEILVKDAAGSPDPDAADGALTLSNRSYIANLYNTEGSEGILDLARDINLQRYISVNYGDYAWGVITDQIEWLSDDTATATLNYRQGSLYEPLSSFTYTKYPPATTLSLAGVGDGETTVTATHARTGKEVSLDVTVETLKNQLYLFQFYPKQTTTVTYENAAGTVTLTSDANGALAVYEPDGIESDVSLRSEGAERVYLGKVYEKQLKSGEQNSANRGLYPVNILQLRNTKLEVYLKKPDGTPWSGSMTCHGAVYKNGKLCPDTLMEDLAAAVPATGLFTLDLNASEFWTDSASETLEMNDDLRFDFIFECGTGDEYYPFYISVDGNLNTMDLVSTGANVSQLRANPAGVPNPFIAAQTVSGGGLIGDVDVMNSAGHIGPSDRIPREVLKTTIFWWGETPDANYGLRLESSAGAALESQSVRTVVFPFYDAAMTVNETVLTAATVGQGTVLNLGPGAAAPVSMAFLRGNGSLYQRRDAAFTVANGVGLPTPENSESLADSIDDLEDQMSDKENFSSDMVEGDTKHIMKALEVLELLTTTAAVKLTVEYAPTEDPLVYTGVITFGGDESEYGPVQGGASIELEVITLEASAYVKTEIRYDRPLNDWSMQTIGGGFYISASNDALKFTTFIPFPPITVELGLQFELDLSLQFLRSPVKSTKTDILLTTGMGAGFNAFAGFGVEADLFSAAIGVYGELMVTGYFSNLSKYLNTTETDLGVPMDNFEAYFAAVLNLSGEIGLKGEVSIIGMGREFSIVLTEFSVNIADTGNWEEISAWVNENGVRDYFGIYSADDITDMAFSLYQSGQTDKAERLLMSIAGGVKYTVTDSGWGIEGRDYLEDGERSWHDGASRRSTLGALTSGSTTVLSNAYPHADPLASDDGELMLYRSDGYDPATNPTPGVNDMNISWATRSGDSYTDRGTIDTDLPAASAFDFDGDGDFAAAAWVAQREDIVFADPLALTDAEIAAMLANTEIVASVYDGDHWATARLTDNYETDMAPVTAAGGGKAIVAWRGMAGSGTEGDDLNMNNVSDRIFYRAYDGAWDDAAILYNGSLGKVYSMDAAMLSNGAAAVVYTVDVGGEGDEADYETFCTVVDGAGAVGSTLRLTNDGEEDSGAQVVACDFGGADGELFVVGWYHSDSAGNGDVVLAAVSADGRVQDGFSESVSGALAGQDVKIGGNFRFAGGESGALEDLHILWSELRAPASGEDAASSVLRAVKLCRDDAGKLYFTAPLTVAETGEETQIGRFDGWSGEAGRVDALLLVTEYGEAGGVGASIQAAYATFGNAVTVSSYVNQAEIVHDFDTAFSFTVTNLGWEPVSSVQIALSDGETGEDFENLGLLPNQSVMLTLPYAVPAGANEIADLDYTLTAQFAGGGTDVKTGALDIAVPDIGVTSLTPVSAGSGLRTFQISLQNRSSVEFFGNTEGYTAHFGVYTDPEFQTLAKDSGGNDMVYQLTGAELALLDGCALTKLVTYPLPISGFANGDIRLFVKAWAKEDGQPVPQYYTGNDTGVIVYTDPVAANGGNPIRLYVEQTNAAGATAADVTVTNLSMTPAAGGNLAVSLLDASGAVLETRIYADSLLELISLAGEESETFTFNFGREGHRVQAGYFTADIDAMNADLASLNLSAIAFSFDGGTTAYSLTARNLGSTTLMAASVNPAAGVAVLDSAGRTLATGVGAVSYTLPLRAEASTGVLVQVTPEDAGAERKTYALSIDSAASTAAGVVISASGGTVTLSAQGLTDFVPASFRYCANGVWSDAASWSAANRFTLAAGTYTSLYARVFDADGRYMDSNTLSLTV
ncbi:MAG TPA: hypothetical protein VN446_00495, partial [Candidatus Acidoferrum sp.]|nr:hypothetical protein [Candidatus Acidoferrum sp.]